MASNQMFSQKCRTNSFALLVIIIFQLLALVLINKVVKEFSGQAYTAFIKPVIFTVAALIFIVVDLYFICNKIILLRSLANEPPIRCVIDDVLFVRSRNEDRAGYTPYLIVRSAKTNKRYFTYGDYSLLSLTADISYSHGQVVECTIYKKDRVPVSIGDQVDVYIYKTLNLPVSVDEKKNVIKLKQAKLPFRHMNKKIPISLFNDIILFKGAIDVDCVNEG